jgi:hypothetical protein
MTLWFAEAAFWAVLGLFGGMIACLLGWLIYLTFLRRKPGPIGVSLRYAGGFKAPAFVGTGGQNAPLAIREDSEGINVTAPWWTIAVMITGMAFFGPGLLALYFYAPPSPNAMPPLPLAIIALLIVAVGCVLLVTTLYKHIFRRPRLQITPQGVRCFKGRAEIGTLGMDDIAYIASRGYGYDMSDGPPVANHILYARSREGDDVPLCVTSKKHQISLLEERLARLGFTIETPERLA